jgi:hypothetical protein
MPDWNTPHQHKLDKGVRHDRELVRRIGVVGGFVKEVWLTPEEDAKDSSRHSGDHPQVQYDLSESDEV